MLIKQEQHQMHTVTFFTISYSALFIFNLSSLSGQEDNPSARNKVYCHKDML